MKRRNADLGKLRRPLKRSKIGEGLYGSPLFYLRFLMVWIVVLLADFLLDFRFEFLWPLWCLLRSVYDSYRYQGLAFSAFFVCIALTADVICLLVVPAHWLFFVASTYVWVQFVWHTDRGLCLPTICLWLLFIYIEASVRLKEVQRSLPFHLDLCRPFAAHCIGYPMVTLGFGFKSFISFKARQRKQKDVQKENEFYLQLLSQALPPDVQAAQTSSPGLLSDKASVRDILASVCDRETPPAVSEPCSSSILNGASLKEKNHWEDKESTLLSNSSRKGAPVNPITGGKQSNASSHHSISNGLMYLEGYLEEKRPSVNDFNEADVQADKTSNKSGLGSSASSSRSNSMSRNSLPSPWEERNGTGSYIATSLGKKECPASSAPINVSSSKGTAVNKKSNREKDIKDCNKLDYVTRIEGEAKKLRADLAASKSLETELRGYIQTLTSSERLTRAELNQVQVDNENLQSKLHSLVTARQQDKQTISTLEKKVTEERRERTKLESQLAAERKNKQKEDSVRSASKGQQCTDQCRMRRRELEGDLKNLRVDVKRAEERSRQLERELESCRASMGQQQEKDALTCAVSALEDMNQQLKQTLSAETKLKLDLFSALGEAKRQLEIKTNQLALKEKEVIDLHSRLGEVLALLPDASSLSPSVNGGSSHSWVLDPNAASYTPKLVRDD
ncbi:unnamed protein product [Cyprideis torosa]|uniref:Macoilin n=1 Tax=Cyprideis torosa TaxID=163714 RepID=A0A7R8W2W2_9CRUS|nr:unnamed protein product [Cyprideis torosa]CAG0881476.1 unnamed protein product [Cyprideis torosa]